MPKVPSERLDCRKIAMGCATFLKNAEKPKVICAAPHEDRFYYRAQIVGRVSPSRVEVLFVDYGNRSVVPYGQLMYLPEEFRKLSPACLKCNLTHEIDRLVDLHFLRNRTEGKKLVLRIDSVSKEEGTFDVTPFFVEDTEEYDYAQLVLDDWRQTHQEAGDEQAVICAELVEDADPWEDVGERISAMVLMGDGSDMPKE